MGLAITQRKTDEVFSWRSFLLDPRVPFDERLDLWEGYAMTLPQIDPPLRHRFAGGMYVREITMPAGAIITSRIHRYESPFFILQGRVWVLTPAGAKLYEAPHTGITAPETRRLLVVMEETVWATVHQNPGRSRDIDELTNRLTYVRDHLKLPDSQL